MEHKKTGVVITGGDFQGLAVLRTFGEKNIPIALVDHEHSIGRYSRYKKRVFTAPKPSDEDEYLEFLLNLAKSEDVRGWVVFPNSDAIVRVVSKYRDVLSEYYRIPVPGWDVIQNVYIKEKTYRLANEHGIAIPKTFYAQSLEEMIAHDLPYPVVIKPSIRDNFYDKVKKKAFLARNEAELTCIYRMMSSTISSEEILVQEFIPGGPKHLYSFCPFFKENRVVAAIMARRARQHPMDFGHATTYAELVDIPELRELGTRFLSLIGYYGLAEVEIMFDSRDNTFKLIEVNPRVWGWHALAIYAGLDLPYLLYQDQIGESLEVPNSLEDVKWIRVTTDVPTILQEIVKGRMTFSEYLASLRGRKRDAVFSMRDPLPFFAEIALIPYLWYKRGF